MPIQLKSNNDGNENNNNENNKSQIPDFLREREEDDTPDFLKNTINDLPAYKEMSSGGPAQAMALESTRKKRNTISIIIASIILIAVVILIVKGVSYMVNSSGKDITDSLTKTEDELASELKLTFQDNNDRVRWIPQYSKGTVTVRSSTNEELHVVYINGKQVGLNTDGRKYRFFGIGVNDPEMDVEKNMTYDMESSFVILNDLMGGNSTTYFYYNTKNNDCFVTTISNSTNRVVSMTYYTNYKKISETLSGLEDDD